MSSDEYESLRPISDFDPIYVPELNLERPRIDVHHRRLKQARLEQLPTEFWFADESGDFRNSNAMVLGTVITEHPFQAERAIKAIRERHKHRFPLSRELKFSGSDEARVQCCLDIIDYFFDCDDLRYAVMVVTKDQQSVRYFTDNVLGIAAADYAYEWYFEQLIEKRAKAGKANLLFFDERSQSSRNRLPGRIAWWGREVLDAYLHDSASEPLIQLADLLTGSVAADFNVPATKTKLVIQDHVKEHLGLGQFSGNRWVDKFNVWRFRAPAEHLIAA